MTNEPLEKPGVNPELPLGVSLLGQMMADWIARLGPVWVEGQVAEINGRGALTFVDLRDVEGESRVKMYTRGDTVSSLNPPIEQGSRVVAQVKADWWKNRGSLQFQILQIRLVGVGELMARIEALRLQLEAEGLFEPSQKKPLPFLPRRIGLVCGKNSDAKHDVIENARRRWPDATFEIREVKVQGATAVKEVSQAVTELDAIEDIDVIVVARGGGSFEDLLPFSDESLIRVIAKAQTPIVVAIGHEEDRPLVDYVADYRASTPTDAARRIVPDVVEEIAYIKNIRMRARSLVTATIADLSHNLASVRAKPALANPTVLIDQRLVANSNVRNGIFTKVDNHISLAFSDVRGIKATLRALSPQGTLDRGFSIVRSASGKVVKSTSDIAAGENLRIKVADGDISVTTDKK